MPYGLAPSRHRSCAALLLLLAAAGCAASRGDPSSRALEAPPDTGEVAVLTLREEPAYDPSLVKLVGTIVNRKAAPVAQASVRVEARDAQGRALTRVIVPASPETITAGGTATFEADVPKSTAVHDYHAEVVGQ
jgi:hypothetical protein